jgi:hypothetical protein
LFGGITYQYSQWHDSNTGCDKNQRIIHGQIIANETEWNKKQQQSKVFHDVTGKIAYKFAGGYYLKVKV